MKCIDKVKLFFLGRTHPWNVKRNLRNARKQSKKVAKDIVKTTKWLNWAMESSHGLSPSDIHGINAFRDVLFLESKLWTATETRNEAEIDRLEKER